MAQQESGTLYLRGVPRQLVREAKAEAARRGMSLTAFAKEALAKALGAGVDEDEEIRSIRPDLDWFDVNRKRLVKRYRDQYVAIINRKVVDHDHDFGALANRIFAKFGNNPVAIPKVTPEERVINVRTPLRVER